MAFDEPSFDISIHTQGHPIRAGVQHLDGFSVLNLSVSAGIGHPTQRVGYFIEQPTDKQIASLIADLEKCLPKPSTDDELLWWAGGLDATR